MTKTVVDITPTWSEMVPVLLRLLTSENHKAREVAIVEMHRMARLADKMKAHNNSQENR